MAAGAVFLAACGGSGFTYVGTSTDRAYFKVPSDWTKFNKQEILVATGLDQSPDSQSKFHFLVGYYSDPSPAIDHVVKPDAQMRYPTVLAYVRKLGFLDHDTYSLEKIRNEVYPLDQLLQAHQAEVLSYRDITLAGGVHGSQIVYNLSGGNFTIAPGNLVFRVAQIGLLDPGTDLFYLFVLRCSADCYRANQSLIDEVVNSWIVKER